MFSGFMVNAWESATLVAIVAGVVGFFVVLRGSAFPAHAIPNGAFAGAAGASLIGVSPLVGLGVFSVLAGLGIGRLSRRSRPDVATALALVMMLALGAAFLSQSRESETQIFSLLFGELVGVSTNELLPLCILAVVCLLATLTLYRPLLLTSLAPDVAAARGVRPDVVDGAFLVVLALATTMTVPVVGALLLFTLMIGPPAAARCLAARPAVAMAGSVVLALATVWTAIALAYDTSWPVGFFVGTLSAGIYVAARVTEALVRRRPARRARAAVA
jgi:zinc/manganese transport system permease protein